jgi:hypothetical protein
MLSSHTPEANNDGCRYTYDVPATAYLGVHFSGFPAVVESVDKKSPMAGKIHPGQSVYAVVVPGQPDLKLQSGGFTVIERGTFEETFTFQESSLSSPTKRRS